MYTHTDCHTIFTNIYSPSIWVIFLFFAVASVFIQCLSVAPSLGWWVQWKIFSKIPQCFLRSQLIHILKTSRRRLFSWVQGFLFGFYPRVVFVLAITTWVFLEEWGFVHHRVCQKWRHVHDKALPNGKGMDPHSLWHSTTHTLHNADLNWESEVKSTQVCLKVRDKSWVRSTCFEVVTNGVLLYSGYFAGAEQHSELVHI